MPDYSHTSATKFDFELHGDLAWTKLFQAEGSNITFIISSTSFLLPQRLLGMAIGWVSTQWVKYSEATMQDVRISDEGSGSGPSIYQCMATNCIRVPSWMLTNRALGLGVCIFFFLSKGFTWVTQLLGIRFMFWAIKSCFLLLLEASFFPLMCSVSH